MYHEVYTVQPVDGSYGIFCFIVPTLRVADEYERERIFSL